MISDTTNIPRRVYFEITQECNLRCKYCFVHKEGSKDMLKKEDIFRLLDELKPYMPRITFSGSEPFMHPDFLEVLGYSKDNGFFTDFYTNGILIDGTIAQFLVKNKIDCIRISIDGTKEINDSIRGEGTYEKVLHALKHLQNAKDGSRLPKVILSPVINNENIEYLDEIIRLAYKYSVDEVNFLTLVWLNDDLALFHIEELKRRIGVDDDYALGLINSMEEMDMKKYKKKIKEVKELAKLLDIEVSFWQSADKENVFSEWYSPRINQDIIKGCGFVFNTARIDHEGNMISCPLIRQRYGSVKDKTLLEVFNGQEAQNFRKEISKKLFPICFKCHRVLV